MAQDPKPIFTIDAAKILAKLHLAGAQQANLPKEEVLINTGILNDQPTPDPMKPGEATFDFSNKSGKYDVGIVKEFKYIQPYDEIDQDYKNKITSKSGLLDKEIEEIEEKIKEQLEKRKTNKAEILKKLKKEAFKQLQTYFINFVGKDNCKQLNENNVVAIPYRHVKRGEKLEFKDYAIEPIKDEAEIKKIKAAAAAKLEKDAKTKAKNPAEINKDPVSAWICFKVGYTAVLETK